MCFEMRIVYNFDAIQFKEEVKKYAKFLANSIAKYQNISDVQQLGMNGQ